MQSYRYPLEKQDSNDVVIDKTKLEKNDKIEIKLDEVKIEMMDDDKIKNMCKLLYHNENNENENKTLGKIRVIEDNKYYRLKAIIKRSKTITTLRLSTLLG